MPDVPECHTLGRGGADASQKTTLVHELNDMIDVFADEGDMIPSIPALQPEYSSMVGWNAWLDGLLRSNAKCYMEDSLSWEPDNCAFYIARARYQGCRGSLRDWLVNGGRLCMVHD